MSRKKTPAERRGARKRYEARLAQSNSAPAVDLDLAPPGNPVSLLRIGMAVYVGEIEGKDTFAFGYDSKNQEIREVTLRPSASLLKDGDNNYSIRGKSKTRTVSFDPGRHGPAIDYFLSEGGRA